MGPRRATLGREPRYLTPRRLGLRRLRRRKDRTPRPYKTPVILSIVLCMICIFILRVTRQDGTPHPYKIPVTPVRGMRCHRDRARAGAASGGGRRRTRDHRQAWAAAAAAAESFPRPSPLRPTSELNEVSDVPAARTCFHLSSHRRAAAAAAAAPAGPQTRPGPESFESEPTSSRASHLARPDPLTAPVQSRRTVMATG